ncbi:MAG: hypothetical protein M3011_02025 [Actinomycetota bacterium]|nr:hypothetical protein [Actinomycetota bacterium]
MKDAPRLEQDGHLDVDGQAARRGRRAAPVPAHARLFRHYGLAAPGDGPQSRRMAMAR